MRGDECSYLHGNSPLPWKAYNAPGGCRFGDKCAFQHQGVPGAPLPANDGAGDSTHATNCGCKKCAVARKETSGRSPELVDSTGSSSSNVATDRAAYVSERDRILKACSNITDPSHA